MTSATPLTVDPRLQIDRGERSGTAPAPCPGRALWRGRMEYLEALAFQHQTVARVASGEAPETLILLEHPPTYTLGLCGDLRHLLVSEQEISRLGAALHRVERGGDITFHGPGQLVGYPVLDLKRRPGGVSCYLRNLEKTLIGTLERFGIEAGHERGFTGVWVGRAKIAAIGVRVNAAGITRHGFALNVNTDLSWFERIVPCGLSGRGVTSIERLLGRAPPLQDVARQVAVDFGAVFQLRLEWWEQE